MSHRDTDEESTVVGEFAMALAFRSHMVTIKDVAAQAGVTPSIVSRLLNQDPTLRVRPETRSRVLSVASELNYAPNRGARALRGARAGAIGAALTHLATPPYGRILKGAEQEARGRDLLVVAIDLDEFVEDPAAFDHFIRGGAIDGMLLQREGLPTDEVVMETLMSAGLPLVIVNERVEDPLWGVALDDSAASHTATEHLIGLGHTRIAHLSVGGSTRRARDRQDGWDRALVEHGLGRDHDAVEYGGSLPETGYAGTRRLLARERPPTAIVAGTLLSAFGALRAINDAGLTSPDDISLVAHHDSWMAEYANPPMTAVRLPMEELGRRAVRLLTARLEGGPARQELITTPAPELIQRASTAPPRRRVRSPKARGVPPR